MSIEFFRQLTAIFHQSAATFLQNEKGERLLAFSPSLTPYFPSTSARSPWRLVCMSIPKRLTIFSKSSSLFIERLHLKGSVWRPFFSERSSHQYSIE
jgi:hypothetical protein